MHGPASSSFWLRARAEACRAQARLRSYAGQKKGRWSACFSCGIFYLFLWIFFRLHRRQRGRIFFPRYRFLYSERFSAFYLFPLPVPVILPSFLRISISFLFSMRLSALFFTFSLDSLRSLYLEFLTLWMMPLSETRRE